MSRPPKKVGSTSGQGVSRRGYQVSRSLGMRGTGSPGGGAGTGVGLSPSAGTGGGGVASGKRSYSKSNFESGPVVAAYTDKEMRNPNLKALTDLPSPRGKNVKGFT